MENKLKYDHNIVYLGESKENNYAHLTYYIDSQNNIVIEHTYVNQSHRGQGLSFVLIRAVINLAKEGHHKIIPICEFAKQVLTSDKKYDYLLVK